MTGLRLAPSTPVVIPFANCHISAAARARALDVMAGGWMTAGQRTQDFEQHFAAWVGARHAVAVSSCTAAIELSLRALALPPGAPVLTPTLTFCGAVHAIVHSGLRPVLVDIDEETLTISPAAAQRACAVDPAAMVVQDMAGYPVDVIALAEAAGLPVSRVVEDAAHGLGASLGGAPVGTVAGASCFSFYATKNLPIGEGGAITTADGEFADRLRTLRLHGMSADAWRRYEPGAGWRYDVDGPGLKANFTDLQAAIGIGQLAELNTWQRRRADLAARYDHHLADVPGLRLPPRPLFGRHAWHLYAIQVEPRFGITRDELITELTASGIGTSVHFIPVHRFSYFREFLGDVSAQLPVAERVGDRILSLPMHPHLSDRDVDRVCERIAELCSSEVMV